MTRRFDPKEEKFLMWMFVLIFVGWLHQSMLHFMNGDVFNGALAVALAHVILTEGLWYRDFVGDFKDGKNRFKTGDFVNEEDFEEIHTHGLVKWWNLELKDKTPEWAAKQTGLQAEQIRRCRIVESD